MKFLKEFYRFSRPHTVIGTTLSIITLYLLAYGTGAREHDWSALFWTLISCLGANIYIVGLNQITDVDIDRINKPYLPLASGVWTMSLGKTVIMIALLISLAVAFWIGRYLLITVLLSLALGTAYSLPPLRLKRFHFWAAFCILAVRGLIVNIFLFLNFHFLLNGKEELPPVIWLLTAVIFLYSIAIAWFKDIPDMEGDDHFAIHTLTLHLGPKRVFHWGNLLLVFGIGGVIGYAATGDLGVSSPILIGFHVAILLALGLAGWWVDLKDKDKVMRYYLFVWVLFFAEYLSFALSAQF